MRLSLTLLLLAGVGALGLAIPALGSAAAPPAVPVLSPLQSVGHLGVVTGRFVGTATYQDIFTVPAGYRVQVVTFWEASTQFPGEVLVRTSAGTQFRINSMPNSFDGSVACHDWVMYPGDTLVAYISSGTDTFWKVVVHKL